MGLKTISILFPMSVKQSNKLFIKDKQFVDCLINSYEVELSFFRRLYLSFVSESEKKMRQCTHHAYKLVCIVTHHEVS